MKSQVLNVVICTYNRAERLRNMLQSLLDADLPPGVQVDILVVDNNSNDATAATVADFTGRDNPRFTYFFEGRQGKSAALNTALKHLTGGIVAFTDDDATVDRNYLNGICQAVRKYPEVLVFAGIVEPTYPAEMPDWIDLDGSMGFLKSAFVDRRDGTVEAYLDELGFSDIPCGCNMFFRREAVDANGDFRVDLGPQGRQMGFDEDSEYCRRLVDKGHRFLFIPSVLVRHPVYPERLEWDYLWNWRYNCGKSRALAVRDQEAEAPRVFGAPRYLYRKCLADGLGFLLGLASKRKRAYHQLSAAYTLGLIKGYRAPRD